LDLDLDLELHRPVEYKKYEEYLLTEVGACCCGEKHKRNASESWLCTMCVLCCKFTLYPLFISSFTARSYANMTLQKQTCIGLVSN